MSRWLPILFLCACGGTSDLVPFPSGGPSFYVGTGDADLWQVEPFEDANLVRHWDGTSWSDLDLAGTVGPSLTGPAAGEGALWLATGVGMDWWIRRLHADGSVEEVELPPAPSAPYDLITEYRLAGGGDSVVAIVQGEAREGTDRLRHHRLSRWNGAGWDPLPEVPEGLVVDNVRVGFDGEVLLSVRDWTYDERCGDFDTNNLDTLVGDVRHGAASPLLWLRGDTWTRISGPRCFDAALSLDLSFPDRTFPMDDLWFRNWHFDGEVLRPLVVPGEMPYDGTYTYVDGDIVRLRKVAVGKGSGGSGWSCDDAGDCTFADYFEYVGADWVSDTWTGAAWRGRRLVAHAQVCTGAGCIYSGDSPGIVGRLEDGSLVIYTSGEKRSGLAVFHP